MRRALSSKSFDVVVIGGGATGAGIALDASSRGLKVALVERGDFASGTSSRSTKLIHGGVRYLEKAVKELDWAQYSLVREALHERGTLLKIAPHLSRVIQLVTPLYHKREIPYYLAGLKMYDWVAGDKSLKSSHFVAKKATLKLCPMLKSQKLYGGVVFHDGQFDDARMNVSILTKAAELGATVGNYFSVTGAKKEKGKLHSLEVTDTLEDATFEIKAQFFVNATGPFSDHIRQITDPGSESIMELSSGVHLVLPRHFSARECGLLIPKTDDGRVLFLLPWLGHTLVGTTDSPAEVSSEPKATVNEIDFILKQLGKYFSVSVQHSDILASWSGLRPLVKQNVSSTAQISREHLIDTLPSGLITIAGGKWTTYRVMAEQTVDTIFSYMGAEPPAHTTAEIILTGGETFKDTNEASLIKDFHLDPMTAKYLSRAYGDRACVIAERAAKQENRLLVEGHPHFEVEVEHAVENEFAATSADVLCRRLRLGFLDSKAAFAALPKVNAILAKKFDWQQTRKEKDLNESLRFLGSLNPL